MTARFRRPFAALVLSATAFACSSSAEPTGSSESSITRSRPTCGDGYKISIDSSGDGQDSRVLTTYSCDPFTIDEVTAAPALASADTCGSNSIPVPSGLAGLGCTLGILVDNQPIFACPASTVPSIPGSLGHFRTNGTPLPECQLTIPNGPLPDGTQCEWSVVVTNQMSFRSSCVGLPANANWVLVVDALFNVGDDPPPLPCRGRLGQQCPVGQPGGCHTGCPLATQPLSN